MLQSLTIKNFALIKKENIEFNSGLNVLLGATGSGKSLIFDAISFVMGQKTDKNFLRFGEDSLKIDALFVDLPNSVIDVLKSYELSYDDLLISRSMQSDGRTSFRVNGEPASLSMVKTLSKLLIDSMVQHESVDLLKTKNHLLMVDKFGGKRVEDLKAKLQELIRSKKLLEDKIESLGGSDETRQRSLELLSFQINEIEKAELEFGEDEEIKQKLELMESSEKIVEVSNLADKNLSSNSLSALSLISDVISALNGLPKTDSINEIYDRLVSLRYELEDLSDNLSNLKNEVSYDEIEFNKLDSRLDLIKSLKKKYGKTIEDVLAYCDELKQKYEDLLGSDELIIKFQSQIDNLDKEIDLTATNLSNLRKEIAKEIEEKIINELKDLGMRGTSFKVNFKEKEVCLDGRDDVEFVFSANVGENLKNLAKTASGGEASRIMLAIKNIFSSIDGISTLIFDEVDSGISGEVGNMVAIKLHNISKVTQVLCITHLPQVAAMADHFYLVEKQVKDEKTESNIKEIEEEKAIEEIARLVSGNEITDVSKQHALELRKRIRK